MWSNVKSVTISQRREAQLRARPSHTQVFHWKSNVLWCDGDILSIWISVASIVRHVAEKTELDTEAINEMIAWPLFEKYGHAFDAFKLSITSVKFLGIIHSFAWRWCLPCDITINLSREPETVFAELNIPEHVMTHLTANIARRLTPQPVKVRADLEATCFAYSGIDAIRTALKIGEEMSTETVPIKIRLVAPPLYVMVSNATDKQGAIELLETAIDRIGESLQKAGGELVVKMKVSYSSAHILLHDWFSHIRTCFVQPKAVSESDDLELAALMERVARENKEVSGDEDSDADWCFLATMVLMYFSCISHQKQNTNCLDIYICSLFLSGFWCLPPLSPTP